jgi:hypothetical protein
MLLADVRRGGNVQTIGIEIDWDGTHLPKELEQLPPGRYFLSVVDDVGDLSDEEDAAVQAGLDALAAGDVVPFDEVIRQIRARWP